MAYEHITDEELDDIFKELDFNQLRELGYYSIDEISDQEELEDFLEAIEEDFSGLSRQEKIEELGGQVIEAYKDYKDSTEGFDAEVYKKVENFLSKLVSEGAEPEDPQVKHFTFPL